MGVLVGVRNVPRGTHCLGYIIAFATSKLFEKKNTFYVS